MTALFEAYDDTGKLQLTGVVSEALESLLDLLSL